MDGRVGVRGSAVCGEDFIDGRGGLGDWSEGGETGTEGVGYCWCLEGFRRVSYIRERWR